MVKIQSLLGNVHLLFGRTSNFLALAIFVLLEIVVQVLEFVCELARFLHELLCLGRRRVLLRLLWTEFVLVVLLHRFQRDNLLLILLSFKGANYGKVLKVNCA